MLKLTSLLLCALLFTNVGIASPQRARTEPDLGKLIAYLTSHRQSPENYVVSKFRDHDIVFIGEYHRIKHDVELIHRLIPRLYKAGVYNLGIEFACYEDQDRADKLITASTYDEAVARLLIFHGLSDWGFKEYEDIYRAAWKLNKSLPRHAHKFRVVNLGYRPNWPARKEQMTSSDWNKVWWHGDPDRHMADVVIKEFADKHQKALVYSGQHHAFTRESDPDRQPVFAEAPSR